MTTSFHTWRRPALMAGRPLGEAAGAALEAHSGFNIGAGLATVIEAGAFVSANPGEKA